MKLTIQALLEVNTRAPFVAGCVCGGQDDSERVWSWVPCVQVAAPSEQGHTVEVAVMRNG